MKKQINLKAIGLGIWLALVLLATGPVRAGDLPATTEALRQDCEASAAVEASRESGVALAPLPIAKAALPLPEPPTELVFPDRTELYAQMFTEAKRRCLEDIDMPRVLKLVQRLRDEKGVQLGADDVTFLKEARKKFLALRSSYKLFANDHKSPKAFGDFVRKFGALNDNVPKIKPDGGKVGKTARKQATAMLELSHDDMLSQGFEPTSPESFREYCRGMLTEMRGLMYAQGEKVGDPKAASPAVSVEEYHDLRKKVRDFKILFDLLYGQDPRPEYQAAGAYTATLSKNMGTIKDGLYDDEIPEEMRVGDEDPGATTVLAAPEPKVHVDLGTRNSIERFLEVFEKALGAQTKVIEFPPPKETPAVGVDVMTPEMYRARRAGIRPANGSYTPHSRTIVSPHLQGYLSARGLANPDEPIPIQIGVFRDARVFNRADSEGDPGTDFNSDTVSLDTSSIYGQASAEDFSQVSALLTGHGAHVLASKYYGDLKSGVIRVQASPAVIQALIKLRSPALGSIQISYDSRGIMRGDGTFK